jgi:alkanesulfonate monooxygenase SsuD/methylene tetrahydromethanopterin reductase-like flavin-dependent oxidoreductase (luciferase family)
MTGVLSAETDGELRARAARLAAKIGRDAGELLANPPHGWIVGTLEPAAAQLHALREAGVSRVMCQHLLHEDLEAVALLGERLAPLVA